MCWILATIVIKKINSLVQKNKNKKKHNKTKNQNNKTNPNPKPSKKNIPVLFVAIWQMWFVSEDAGISSCSIAKLAFARAVDVQGCEMQGLYLAVLPIMSDQKLPGKKNLFSPF